MSQNYQITQLQTGGSLLVLHPETNASIVKHTVDSSVTQEIETVAGEVNVGRALDVIISEVGKLKTKTTNGVIAKIKTPGNTELTGSEVELTYANMGLMSVGDNTKNVVQRADEAYTQATNAASKAQNAIEIANGKVKAYVFQDYETLVNSSKLQGFPTLRVGDSVYIKAASVPDLWVSAIDITPPVDYTFTNNNAFINALMSTGVTIGTYLFSPLETKTVDLTEYYKKSESDARYVLLTDYNTLSSNYLSTKQTVDNIVEGIEPAAESTHAANATTADKLKTARNIGINVSAAADSDITVSNFEGSSSFNGSAAIDISATPKFILTETGVNEGTYSALTVDKKGRVKAGGISFEIGATVGATASSTLAVGGIFFKRIS